MAISYFKNADLSNMFVYYIYIRQSSFTFLKHVSSKFAQSSGCEVRVFERSDIVRKKFRRKSDFVRHSNLSSYIFLSFKLSSRVFSSNSVNAVFEIKTQLKLIIPINKAIGTKILLSYRNFPFGNQNHKQEQVNPILVSKFQKTPVSNFIAINQVKEQGTNALSRHRNLLFWF